MVVGELGLEGGLRPVRGALPIALEAKSVGIKGVIVPAVNLAEAGVVNGLEILGAESLEEVADFFAGRNPLRREQVDTRALFGSRARDDVDFAEVKGQEHAKRALEIAAAGAHNLFML